MKGYMNLLLGFFMMLIVFAIVNWYLSTRLYFESGVSDLAGQTYKMINAIEFGKINSQQSLKFAIQKTEKDLHVTSQELLQNTQIQPAFLDKLKKNYNPSLDYSDVDVSVTVLSLTIETDRIIASNLFSATSESRSASLTADITAPLS